MVTIKSVDRETLTPSDLETYRTLIRPSALPLLDHQAAGTQLILIEARDNQTIVGLALAKFFSWNSAAELFSLFVREDKRQKGIGLKLFQALQDTLIQKGCIALGFQYESTSPFSIAIDKILAHLQWPPATLSLLRCYFKAAEFKPKWLQIRPKLPRGMTIFPWKKLKSAERFVIECQAKQEAFHASISPFLDEEHIEPLNSLGLRYRQRVVGWVITHRLQPDTITYTTLYIERDYYLAGYAINLLIESILRQKAHADSAPWALFEVNRRITEPAWWTFVQKRLIPHAQKVEQFKWALRVFGYSTPSF